MDVVQAFDGNSRGTAEVQNQGSIGLVEDRSAVLTRRRAALAAIYAALPLYASSSFWHAITDPTLPLEVLVRVLRAALARGDQSGARRITAELIRRTQDQNRAWARQVLRGCAIVEDERDTFGYDLCADLNEALLRAVQAPQRHFWEENFWHALYLERKHVLRTFMVREGLWVRPDAAQGSRIPRALIARLDKPGLYGDVDEIQDERAQTMFLAVEQSELLQLVLQLPKKLKAIVLLIFWEGRTEKEAASLLMITERTVRNRLRAACQLLRELLTEARKGESGL